MKKLIEVTEKVRNLYKVTRRFSGRDEVGTEQAAKQVTGRSPETSILTMKYLGFYCDGYICHPGDTLMKMI